MQNDAVEVVVCLGSSCYARGNSENLNVVKSYESHGVASLLRFKGCLCQDRCQQSPNVRIDGQLHPGVTSDKLRALLDHLVASAAVGAAQR